MTSYNKEEAEILLKEIVALITGKPMGTVIHVIANVLSNGLEAATEEQKLHVLSIIIDALGMSQPEETIQ